MHFLIVTPIYPPDLGRLTGYLKILSVHLAKNHKVTVMTYGDLPEQTPGVRVLSISKRLPTALRLILFTIRLWQEARHADALTVCDGAAVGLPSLMVSRLCHLPLIRCVMENETRERFVRETHLEISDEVFPRYPLPDRKLRIINWLQVFILKHATRVIVPSSFFKQLLTDVFAVLPERMEILAYPPEPLRKLPFPIIAEPHSVYIPWHHMTPQDFVETLDALEILRSRVSDIRCIIVDQSPLTPEQHQMVLAKGLRDHLRCLGPISSAERSSLLLSCDVCYIPQTTSPHLEMMYQAYAARIVVIATHTPHHEEGIDHHHSGYLIPPHNPKALASAIEMLLPPSEVRSRLIMGGTAFLAEHASWEAHVPALIAHHAL